jgi:L-serine deaminase
MTEDEFRREMELLKMRQQMAEESVDRLDERIREFWATMERQSAEEKERFARAEKRMDRMEKRMDKVEKTLAVAIRVGRKSLENLHALHKDTEDKLNALILTVQDMQRRPQ